LIRLALILLAAWAGRSRCEAVAETVVAGLSRDAISITTNFEGSEILIFGAVSRVAPPPEGSELHVIVTVEGPPRPVTVRRKARRFGIWVNTDAIEVDAAPTFYAVAATGDLDTVLTRDRGPAPSRLDPARDPGRRHRGRRSGTPSSRR
jgi:uncharacterized protein (TIGR02186 family)